MGCDELGTRVSFAVEVGLSAGTIRVGWGVKAAPTLAPLEGVESLRQAHHRLQ
jgi:hypothetical protein